MRWLALAIAGSVVLAGAEAAAQGAGGAPTAPDAGRPGSVPTPAPPSRTESAPRPELEEPGAPASPETSAPRGAAPAAPASGEPAAPPPVESETTDAPTAPPDPSEAPPRRHQRKPPEPEPPPPPARDTVGGHVAIGAEAGYGAPLGSFGGASHRSLAGPGLALSADIGYGVSRTVMIGLYGALGSGEGRGAWAGEDVSSFGVGPLVRYHLVQGTRFDPWISYGIGFRQLTTAGSSQKGIDWARIQLGGDWYAFPNLGIGPVLELALRSFLDPPAELGDGSLNAHLVFGGRLVFDTPGK